MRTTPAEPPYTSTLNRALLPNPLDLREPARRWWAWFCATDPQREVEEMVRTHCGWAPWWFGDCTGRMVDAAILCRQVRGDDTIGEHEEYLRSCLRGMFDPRDGLNWRPETVFNVREANMFDQSSVLLALVSWFMESGSAEVEDLLQRMIGGLWAIAAKQDDCCYYPFECYGEKGWDRDYPASCGKARYGIADPCHEGGRQINPLVRYYELTGSAAALRLADGLARYVMGPADLFEADGCYREEGRAEKTYRSGHIHSRLSVATGVMRLGFATGHTDYVAWGKHVFDWTLRTQCTSFGWVGEVMDRYERGSETCGITDAIEAAALLARNGYDDYWGIVARFGRNHLLESQSRRNGGFNGHSFPHEYAFVDTEWVPGQTTVLHPVAGCCAPAGMRGIYGVWDHIVTRQGTAVSVNLPLARQSRWVRVRGHEPFAGQVDIMVDADVPVLRVRVPEGGGRNDVRVTVNDRPVTPAWDGAFLLLRGCAVGEIATVQYPLRRYTETVTIHGHTFTVTWVGSTVVGMEPAGQYEPLYLARNTEWYTTAPQPEVSSLSTREVCW